MSVQKRLPLVIVAGLLAVGLVGLGRPLRPGVAQAPSAPTTEWVLQGRVYEGEIWDETAPLAGVTVSVYGAYAAYDDAGTFIRSTTTDATGWYGVVVYDDDGGYNYYYILESDPGGYISVGARTVSGTVQTENWIEFAAPLDTKTLTGNKFWDEPYSPTWTLQGRVYEGEIGDQSRPLEGVTVSLYGGNDAWPVPGQILTSTTTNEEGWYGLTAAAGYEYYHIRETDPPGYSSVGATTVSGTVRTENWIEIAVPLEGKTLTGNKFWDAPTVTDPDLIVTDVWDEGSDVCYQLENIGSGPAGGGHVTALHVDAALVTSQTVAAELAPGERWDGCFPYAWTCTPAEDHLVVIADSAGTVSESEEGNNAREELWPCDDVPPEITAGPVVADLTTNSAVIWWTTSEPCDSQVRLGRMIRALEPVHTDVTLVFTHEVPLPGLDPATTYAFTVHSTDASSNTVDSRAGVFQTLPEDDGEDPDVFVLDPGVYEGEIVLEANASDNTDVKKVEFLIDGVLVFTDYSPPFQLNLDTSLYANGEHGLMARAFDPAGRVDEHGRVADFNNLLDQGAPFVDIIQPADEATVSGNPISVTAIVSDDKGLVGVNFFAYSGTQYINSDAEPYSTPYPTQTQVTFNWNVYHEDDADYYISVQAVDDDANFTTANLNLTLHNDVPLTPPQYPWLEVVQHSATRFGNFFHVTLEVKNSGNVTATDIQILDSLNGFQAISATLSHADFDADRNPIGKFGLMRIRPKFDIPPGQKRIYTFHVVPVVSYPNPPTPAIGAFIDLGWESPSQKPYYSYVQLPVAKTTGGQTIPQAHASALATADYLLVTNPYRLFAMFAPTYYLGPTTSSREVNMLLSSMAELARYRNGVLGYYDASGRVSASSLKNLLQPAGAWGKAMGINFYLGGSLLLVGETEIIGTWISKGWSYQDGIIQTTDQPFGNMGGDKAPEIAVSRIPGNQPRRLRNAILNSLNVIKGVSGYGYDRSHALLVSGTGNNQSKYVDNVDDIAGILSGQGVSVNKLHWKDYGLTARLPQFRNRAPNQDIIFYRDHGYMNSWGWDDDLHVNHFPVNLGNTNPFVYASACLAGNFETHRTRGGGDNLIVEAFMDSGAAAYLGATEVSPTSQNSNVGKMFFDAWWSSKLSVGATLASVEHYLWKVPWFESKYRFWVYEYNMYGDAKFGAIPGPLTAPGRAEAAAAIFPTIVLTAPTPILDVAVPDFEVNSVAGTDYVEIPGGLWWAEEGEPEVPIYPVSVEIPAGFKVQQVHLLSRGGLTETSGLNLSLCSMVEDCTLEPSPPAAPVVQLSLPSAPAVEVEWLPDREFDWTTEERLDGGSDLAITVYPFHYNPLTRDVMFYQDYSFEIIYAPASVAVTKLALGSQTYAPGDEVTVDIELENTGSEPLDVVVSADVQLHGSGAPVGGLLLTTLTELTGTASFSPQWDSSGTAPGLYDVEVTLRDLAGNLLDRESQMFDLGAGSGEVVTLTVTPATFDIGDTIDITMIFSNTGTVEITGTARIRVLDEAGLTVEEFTQPVEGLAPQEALTIEEAWHTAGRAEGAYGVVGYVAFDGMVTDPLAAALTTEREWGVHLPLIVQAFDG